MFCDNQPFINIDIILSLNYVSMLISYRPCLELFAFISSVVSPSLFHLGSALQYQINQCQQSWPRTYCFKSKLKILLIVFKISKIFSTETLDPSEIFEGYKMVVENFQGRKIVRQRIPTAIRYNRCVSTDIFESSKIILAIENPMCSNGNQVQSVYSNGYQPCT